MVFRLSTWIDSGKLVEKPFIYIWSDRYHSGSKNNKCDGCSENRFTLSSIEGQYLGPTPFISPLYIGDSWAFLSIILCVFSLVLTV